MENDREYYLRRAAQASALAELAADDRVKAIHLKMAHDYLALSERNMKIKKRSYGMRLFLKFWRTVLALALTLLSLSTASAGTAQQPAADAIIGKWEADDGTSKLELYRAGAQYQARLLYGSQLIERDGVTMKKDLKNPDPKLRDRSLKNIVFARGLVFTDTEWAGGSIYDAASGRTYRCKASMKDGKLQLRGYFGIPALGRTQAFHRIP